MLSFLNVDLDIYEAGKILLSQVIYSPYDSLRQGEHIRPFRMVSTLVPMRIHIYFEAKRPTKLTGIESATEGTVMRV